MSFYAIDLPTDKCPRVWKGQVLCSWSCAAAYLAAGNPEPSELEVGSAWLRLKGDPMDLSDEGIQQKALMNRLRLAMGDRSRKASQHMHTVRNVGGKGGGAQAGKGKDMRYQFYAVDSSAIAKNPVECTVRQADFLDRILIGRVHAEMDVVANGVVISSGVGRDRLNVDASRAVGASAYGPVLVFKLHK